MKAILIGLLLGITLLASTGCNQHLAGAIVGGLLVGTAVGLAASQPVYVEPTYYAPRPHVRCHVNHWGNYSTMNCY